MRKAVGIIGSLALLLAVVDIIHGQDNGDIHRQYIHIIEFVCFFSFLCLLAVWTFKAVKREVHINSWLIVLGLSLLSCMMGLMFFAMAGGSSHGDGGPIAFSFVVIAAIAMIAVPVSFVGFLVAAILRKRKGVPILMDAPSQIAS